MKIKNIFLILTQGFVLAAFLPGNAGFADVIVAGYYPSWLKWTLPPEKIQFENLTHIIHAFAWPSADGTILPSPLGDINDPKLITETHKAQKKILIALGGWGNSGGFSPMVKDSTSRKTFIKNITEFTMLHQYDGIDLDWEFPASSADRSNLNLFVKELRTALDKSDKGLLITMAVPAGSYSGDWFDYSTLKNDINWFGCMTYDFFGSWINKAGHNAPLYPPAQNNNGSVQSSINYLVSQRSVPKEKILLGIPFYGRGCSASGYNESNIGGNSEYRYAVIQPMIGNDWTYYWDDVAKVPYLLNNSRTYFISFDDTLSVRFKCEYAKDQNLVGVMMWALSHDLVGGNQPLLQTIGKSMRQMTEVKIASERSPESSILFNNYPNPFNGQTIISFYIPKEEKMSMKIYNVLGECVSVLFDEKMKAGQHQCVFHSDGYSSGNYFYHLSGSSFSTTGKMTILQ